MSGARKYVDNVLGNNANTGDNPGSGGTGAYADLSPLFSGGWSGGDNGCYVKNTGVDYASASTITWLASLKGDTTNGPNWIEGYTTTPGARDGRPTFSCSGSGVAVMTFNDNDVTGLRHLRFTHTHATTKGLACAFVTSESDSFLWDDCVIDGCSAMMTQASNLIPGPIIIGGEVKGCTSLALQRGFAECRWCRYREGIR